MKQWKVVDVPVKMEKFFGKGKMLHPDKDIVENLVRTIPSGMITTIDILGKKLADDYGTKVTCPMRLGNIIKKMSTNHSPQQAEESIPFWRVIRTDQMMVKLKDYEFWAAKLEHEGFALNYTPKEQIKIQFKNEQLFKFGADEES